MKHREPGGWLAGGLGAMCLIGLIGCAGPLQPVPKDEALRQQALRGLKAGLTYEPNALIRVQAIEALQECEPGYALEWVREATRDPVAAVRFAACMSLGMRRDEGARELMAMRVEDQDPSVRVAAIFALHRLKDARYTSQLADFLLTHHDPAVRGNAALALGRMGEKNSVHLLRRALKDKDNRVRMQGLEAAAILGDPRAIKRLGELLYVRSGPEQAFAALALGRAGVKEAAGPLKLKLEHGPHLETRLAAARALGMLGYPIGYNLALEYLRWKPKSSWSSGETPADVAIMRVRTSAALALGAIGRREALPGLYDRMRNDPDPRIQISCARGVLEILNGRGGASETEPINQRSVARGGASRPEGGL